MIISMIRRDLRGKYKGSILGFLWTFINPLLQLSIYTIVFSTFMRMGIKNYEIFLFVALIPWMFFANNLVGSAGAILYNHSLVTKIYFPREVLPIAVTTSNFINMFYCFFIVFAVVLLFNDTVNLCAWILIPGIALIQYILVMGISLIMSSLTVYYRDLEHILGVLALGWQFLTPVMYPEYMVPEKYMTFIMLNPMSPIVISYRDILYYGKFPDMNIVLCATIEAIIILILGVFVFNRLKKTFAEAL